jgi:DNA (cytosine-5)-methyltransferase 1
MKTISLFSGVGGMDLGFQRAGFEHVAFCEADAYRREVLARHWPDVPIYDDVRTFDYQGQVDCLIGGFPCQDLSVAGRRAGLAGERSGLFYDAIRIADRVVQQGGYVVLENVAGLLSSNHGRDFAIVLRSLADIGFTQPTWRVLDSQFFGVPQRRKRIFVVAQRSKSSVPGEVLDISEGGNGNITSSRRTQQDDSGTTQTRFIETARRLNSDRRGHNNQALAFHHKPDPISGVVSPALSKNADGMGILSWDSLNHKADTVVPTMGANTGMATGRAGVISNESVVRRLTPVECERLQGWPDGWTLTSGSSLLEVPRWFEAGYQPSEDMTRPDGRRYAACGDGVTATVAEWIARRLLAEGGA